MEKLNSQSVKVLGLLKLAMVAAGYSNSSITTYLREIRNLCAYHPGLGPDGVNRQAHYPVRSVRERKDQNPIILFR